MEITARTTRELALGLKDDFTPGIIYRMFYFPRPKSSLVWRLPVRIQPGPIRSQLLCFQPSELKFRTLNFSMRQRPGHWMKSGPSISAKAGFTLIELLVVI